MVASSGAPRIYEITPATTNGVAGQALAIEVAANTISATLPVGVGPVYGVMTLDSRRAFILNQADGTVSVINAQNNALDTPVSTITVGTAPVWADLASGLNEMVVANEGNGTSPGSLSIVDISLCSLRRCRPTRTAIRPTDRLDDLRARSGDGPGGHQSDHGVGAKRLYAGVRGQCGAGESAVRGERRGGGGRVDQLHGVSGKPDFEHGDGDDPDRRASCLYCDVSRVADRQGVRGVQRLAGDDRDQDGHGQREYDDSAAGIWRERADDATLGQLLVASCEKQGVRWPSRSVS